MNKLARNTLALGTVTMIVTAGIQFSAQAAPTYKTYAESTFLSGSLDALANTGKAVADNNGTQAGVKQENATTLSVLDAITVPGLPALDLGTLLGAGSIQAGAVEQYATAFSAGNARGATGAVTDSGGVDVGSGAGGSPTAATVDLTKLLDGAIAADVLNGSLTVSAVTAVADQSTPTDANLAATCGDLSNPTQCRDYNIAGLDLDLNLPVLQTINTTALTPLVNSTLGDIDGLDLVNDVCTPLNLGALCATLGINLNVTTPAVNTVLGDLATLTGGGIDVNLNTGAIHVDVDEVLAGLDSDPLQINNIQPTVNGTEILNRVLAALPSAIGELISDAISGDGTTDNPGIVNRILDGSSISLTAAGATLLDLSAAQLQDVLEPALTTLTDDVLAPLLTNVGETLGDVTTALQGVAAIYVNRQFTEGDLLKQNAAQLRLLDTVNVNLATAAVRPATVVVPPTTPPPTTSTPTPTPTTTSPTPDSDGPSTDADSGSDGSTPVVDNGDDSDTVADADAQADADVTTTLPSTGAPNLLPFWLLGIALLLFGGAVLVNEKRRLNAQV